MEWFPKKLRSTSAAIALATAIACAGITSVAAADVFCDDVSQAADQVRNGQLATSLKLPEATTCQSALQLDGAIWFCFWTYPLRDESAAEAYRAMGDSVRRCGGTPADADPDLKVNHPDSYDTRLFDLNGVRASVALKDKAALRSTLVFLRLSPMP